MKISARNVLAGTVSKVTKGAVNAEVDLTLEGGDKVAAVINNGIDIAGVANVRIMALEALGPNGEGSSTNTSLAIQWAADHGARIIHLSLGTNTTVIGPNEISNAIDYAWSKGALVLAAAAVNNTPMCTVSYPARTRNSGTTTPR